MRESDGCIAIMISGFDEYGMGDRLIELSPEEDFVGIAYKELVQRGSGIIVIDIKNQTAAFEDSMPTKSVDAEPLKNGF